MHDELEKTKLEYSQTILNIQMTRKVESSAIQTELQTLHEEIVKDKISRARNQKFIQGYVEQVKQE